VNEDYLKGNNITGNEVGRVNFRPLAGTSDFGLGGQGVHQSLNGIASRSFFIETNTGILSWGCK
jgi:hypothetical protein